MGSKSTDSLRNMCRTCMSPVSNDVQRNTTVNNQCIYEVPIGSEDGTSLIELLQIVQPRIKVQMKDDLPKLMCSDCIKKLQEAYAFLEMYKDVDKKFRKMLKEINTTNYLKSLDETLEYIEEKEVIEDNLDEDDEIHQITKFEIEIEKINDEECENVNVWPEFEEEPIHEISDEYEEKNELFDNPYSDASDNECGQSDTSQNETHRKIYHKKDKANFGKNVNHSSVTNPNSNSKRKISKNKESFQETHMPLQNEDGSVSCQECDVVLENVSLWQKHIRQHRLGKLPKRKYVKKTNKPKKDYNCEYCGKEFPRVTAYRNHVRTHTGEEPYLCIECGKSFKVVSSLNTHMLRHKGEKTIQCPHCPKKFVCSSGLYGHMMVHTKEKPFVCDICGSAFHMAYQLRKHNLYHNNIKNYQCEYCDMRFVTGEKQRRHMRTHTGEKPYRCKYCERAFAQSNDCIKHLRQHLGDNVYQCELCPLRFPLARDLRAHFASHKDDDDETRTRNLEARMEEERNLQIKLGVQDV